MSPAAFTASTDSGLIRATSPAPLAQRLRVGQREAVGHAGNVVDRVFDRVAPGDEVIEDTADDLAGATVLRLDLRAQVDALEHEAPEREHRLPDLVRLADVAGGLRRLD